MKIVHHMLIMPECSDFQFGIYVNSTVNKLMQNSLYNASGIFISCVIKNSSNQQLLVNMTRRSVSLCSFDRCLLTHFCVQLVASTLP